MKAIKAIGLIVLRAVLVTAIVVISVMAAWTISYILANAFGALEVGLANLARSVWSWDWASKLLAVCVIVLMTYILQTTIHAYNRHKNNRKNK